MVTMGRINATFRYRNQQEPETDPQTGFITGSADSGEWSDGGMCQVDRHIPAKVLKGVDGMEYTYTYDLFILKPYDSGDIRVGTEIEVTMEDGSVDGFTAQGVDNCRRYIEVWG